MTSAKPIKRTPAQVREAALVSNALGACRVAENRNEAARERLVMDLPRDRRRAARALLYAALSHCYTKRPYEMPKTFYWCGHRWHLEAIGQGRLQVAPHKGWAGIVSMPGALEQREAK